MVECEGEGGTQLGRQEVTKVPKIECKDQLGTPRGESDVQIAHYFLQSTIAHKHSIVGYNTLNFSIVL